MDKFDTFFDFLNSVQKETKISSNLNATFVIGLPQSGKSILTQFIANDTDTLKSIKKDNTYIIEDIRDGVEKIPYNPELFEDAKLQDAYYDVPSFGAYGANATLDIASAFALKTITDQHAFIKIILTFPYDLIKKQEKVEEGRAEFRSLLEHSSIFIENMKTYKRSIALIVTKVESTTEESEVFKEIHNFLVEIKKETKKFTESKELLEKAKILLKIFLKEKEGKFPYVGLFKIPDSEGILSEIKSMQEGREDLIKIASETLKSAKKKRNEDFYPNVASDTSKYLEILSKKISYVVNNLSKNVNKYFKKVVEKSKNMHELTKTLKSNYKTLKNIHINVTFHENLYDNINEGFNVIGINLSKVEFTTVLFNYGDLVTFFQVVNRNFDTSKWLKPLKKSQDNLYEIVLWYKFLSDLRKALSTYEIQNGRMAFLEEIFGQDAAQKGFKVNKKNFNEVFGKLRENCNKKFKAPKGGFEISDKRLKLLNEILKITLKKKNEVTCEDGKVRISGDYVRISEVVKQLECENLNRIEVFAMHTIFIDEDIDVESKKVQLFMMGPYWEIIPDEVTFTLNGTEEEIEEESEEESEELDIDGDAVNLAPGQPGLPGQNSGSFIGIGLKSKNKNILNVNASGGTGGSGTDGDNGQHNHTWVDTLPKYNQIEEIECNNDLLAMEKGLCKEFNSYRYCCIQSNQTTSLGGHNILFNLINIQKTGEGFVGGSGGIGGRKGLVKIVVKKLKKNVVNADGDAGEDGLGGRNEGSATTTIAYVKSLDFNDLCGMQYLEESDEFHVVEERNEGEKNVLGKLEPDQIDIQPADTINRYKEFLLENMSHFVRKQLLIDFYIKISERKEIADDLYNTQGFLDELELLERHFTKLKHDLNFLPLYERLKRNIYKYVGNPQSSEVSDDYKKVLNYVYTATLSKIFGIKENLGDQLITDIKVFLDTSIEEIQELETVSNANAISERNKDYKQGLDEVIEEAEAFINDDINKDIKQIGKDIKEAIVAVDEELDEMIEETKEEIEKLHELEKIQQHNLLMTGIFSSISVLGDLCNLVPGLGRTVGGYIQQGSTLGSEFFMKNESGIDMDDIKTDVPPKVVENFQSLSEQTQAVKKNTVEVLKKVDKFAKQGIGFSEATQKQFNKNIRRLEKQNADTDIEEVVEAEKKAENLLKEERKKAKIAKNNERIKFSNGCIKVFTVSQTATTIYNEYVEQQDKLEKCQGLIKSQEEKLEQLKRFKVKIFATLIPLMKDLRETIENLQSELPEQNVVGLDITKWQLPKRLGAFKDDFADFVTGFSTLSQFTACFEKLDEAFSFMIHLYERIQTYREQKTFADYIYHMNSNVFINHQIEDEALSAAVTKLEQVIKSNIVLEKYEYALEGFKQYAFPFAEESKLEIYDSFIQFNKTEDLLVIAVNNLKKIRHDISKDLSITKEHNKYQMEQEFNPRKNKGSDPIFTWKNKEYEATFAKFLSGEEIFLKSDVSVGTTKNAVKFNEINLNFIGKNSSVQEELDEALASFAVEMKHLGSSYFLCNHNTYVIRNGIKEFVVGLFDKSLHNEIYKKVKKGKPMLSPYTMWKLQLTRGIDTFRYRKSKKEKKRHREKKPKLDELKKFEGLFDLQLVGKCSYVRASYGCSLMLGEYYSHEKSVSPIQEDFALKRRSTRSIKFKENSVYDVEPLTNGASGISSPINKFFNQINPSWVFTQQLDSFLAFAPIFINFWGKFFRKNNFRENKVQVSSERLELWENFLKHAENLVLTLEREIGRSKVEIFQYKEALEMRMNEFYWIRSQSEIDQKQLREFEVNLIAFEVDLRDDFECNKEFRKFKNNFEFWENLENLFKITKEIPKYTEKLKLVKLETFAMENEGFEYFKRPLNLRFVDNSNLTSKFLLN